VFFAGNSVSTDNAYTAVEVAQITPLISGPVKQVKVVDAQAVRAGDVLIVLDDTDARIALAQAAAQLERTKQQVRQLLANDLPGRAGGCPRRGATCRASRSRQDTGGARQGAGRRQAQAQSRRGRVPCPGKT
jgi:membrane fusion protein (multidrug efflux system)